MIRIHLMTATLLACCCVATAQDKSNVYEQAVTDAVVSYVDAFNQRDAKRISQHWAEDGEFVDADGNLVVGRENIEKTYTAMFKESPADELLSVTINRISFVTKDVAIEEGVADVAGEKTSYSAVHKFKDGKWQLHSIRESVIPPKSTNYDNLKELEWMVGEWVDHSDEAVVRSSCRWSKNQNFLMKNFSVELPDVEPLEGTQVIGFDPSKGQIRSWTFDSDGGFAEGTWSRKDNKWEVRSTHVLTDGRTATSKNIFTLVDENQFTWRSIGRQVDGEFLPNIETVSVMRLKEEPAEEIIIQNK